MAAYAKPGTAIYRDLSLAEYPYSLHSLGPHALVAASFVVPGLCVPLFEWALKGYLDPDDTDKSG